MRFIILIWNWLTLKRSIYQNKLVIHFRCRWPNFTIFSWIKRTARKQIVLFLYEWWQELSFTCSWLVLILAMEKVVRLYWLQSLWDQGQDQPLPWQTTDSPHISQWHHSLSAMFISSNDGPFLQQCWATSYPKDHIIIKSSPRGLQWDLCYNPQETAQDSDFKNSF